MDEVTVTETLSKKIDDVSKLIGTFQSEHKSALEKNEIELRETKAKLELISAEMATKMIEYQNEVNQLKAAAQLADKFGVSRNKLDELRGTIREELNGFIRGKLTQGIEFSEFLNTKGKKIESLAMSIGVQESGGFFSTPELLAPELIRDYGMDTISSLIDLRTTSKNSVQFKTEDGERVGATWVAEKQARPTTATRILGEQIIQLFSMYSFPELTQDEIDDTGSDLVSFVLRWQDEDFKLARQTAFVNGATPGKPRGFMTFAKWTTAKTYEHGKIEQVTSEHATEITPKGIMKAQTALRQLYQPKAVWLANPYTLLDLNSLMDGTGGYMFNRGLDRNAAAAFQILGKPLFLCDDMPVSGAGLLPLVYGDMKSYRGVMKNGRQIIYDNLTNKPFVGIYAVEKAGGDVMNFEGIKILRCTASTF